MLHPTHKGAFMINDFLRNPHFSDETALGHDRKSFSIFDHVTILIHGLLRFLGLLRKYCSGANKQGYYLAGLETLVARDIAWLEVLPKVCILHHFVFQKHFLVSSGVAFLV